MIDNLYRIAVILLLAVILGLLAYNLTPAPESEACLAAIAAAERVLDTVADSNSEALDEYQADAYDRADNINQQIFMASEYAFVSQNIATILQQAQLRVAIACR